MAAELRRKVTVLECVSKGVREADRNTRRFLYIYIYMYIYIYIYMRIYNGFVKLNHSVNYLALIGV